jgi:hypothetical protein
MMGSGSYLGGSTVVHGGWAWSGKSGLSRPKKKTPKQIERLNRIRLDFLRNVIEAEINGIAIKKIKNQNQRAALSEEGVKKGGIKKWAQSQSQYHELKIKKIKRKAKKVAKRQDKSNTETNKNKAPNEKINTCGMTLDERRSRLLLRDRRSRLLRKIAKSNSTKNVKSSVQEWRSFKNEINQKGSLIKWAESQSQYKEIINRLKDKK